MAAAYTIAFDAASTKSTTSTPTSWNHTCADAGGNSVLFVAITGTYGAGSPNGYATTLTYGGVAMSKYPSLSTSGSSYAGIDVWYLISPPTGTNSISWSYPSLSGDQQVRFAAVSYTGVSKLSLFDSISSQGTSPISTTVVSANSWLLGFASTAKINASATVTMSDTTRATLSTGYSYNPTVAMCFGDSNGTVSTGSQSMTFSYDGNYGSSNGGHVFSIKSGGWTGGGQAEAWDNITVEEAVTITPIPYQPNIISVTDKNSTGASSGGSPISVSVNVGNYEKRMILVAVSAKRNGSLPSINYVNLDGSGMTLLDSQSNGYNGQTWIYYSLDPSVGSHNVSVSATNADRGLSLVAASLINVDQSGIPDASDKGGGSGSSNSRSITTVNKNCSVFYAVGWTGGSGFTLGADQESLGLFSYTYEGFYGSLSRKSTIPWGVNNPGSTIAMSATSSGGYNAGIEVALNAYISILEIGAGGTLYDGVTVGEGMTEPEPYDILKVNLGTGTNGWVWGLRISG